jgi:hypothetical protein
VLWPDPDSRRTALPEQVDFAIEHGIPHGGWCPRERLAEDGAIDARLALGSGVVKFTIDFAPISCSMCLAIRKRNATTNG